MPRHFLYLPFTPAGRSNRATPAKRARQRRQSGGGASPVGITQRGPQPLPTRTSSTSNYTHRCLAISSTSPSRPPAAPTAPRPRNVPASGASRAAALPFSPPRPAPTADVIERPRGMTSLKMPRKSICPSTNDVIMLMTSSGVGRQRAQRARRRRRRRRWRRWRRACWTARRPPPCRPARPTRATCLCRRRRASRTTRTLGSPSTHRAASGSTTAPLPVAPTAPSASGRGADPRQCAVQRRTSG